MNEQMWCLTPSTVWLSWNKLRSIDPVLCPRARCCHTGFWVWRTGQWDGGRRQCLRGWQLLVLCWFTVFEPEEAHRTRTGSVTVSIIYCLITMLQECYNQRPAKYQELDYKESNQLITSNAWSLINFILTIYCNLHIKRGVVKSYCLMSVSPTDFTVLMHWTVTQFFLTDKKTATLHHTTSLTFTRSCVYRAAHCCLSDKASVRYMTWVTVSSTVHSSASTWEDFGSRPSPVKTRASNWNLNGHKMQD